jgi:PBP1b-binding outer membrane lipoprotein LpoB
VANKKMDKMKTVLILLATLLLFGCRSQQSEQENISDKHRVGTANIPTYSNRLTEPGKESSTFMKILSDKEKTKHSQKISVMNTFKHFP